MVISPAKSLNWCGYSYHLVASHLFFDGFQVSVTDKVLSELHPGQSGAPGIWEELEEALLWFKVTVCVDQFHVSVKKNNNNKKQLKVHGYWHDRLNPLDCYSRVDQLVADLAGEEDVWAQAQLVPEALVAHRLLQVPQAEDSRQSHEAVGVVSCFGCHVRLFFSGSDQDGAVQGTCEDKTSEAFLMKQKKKIVPFSKPLNQRTCLIFPTKQHPNLLSNSCKRQISLASDHSCK